MSVCVEGTASGFNVLSTSTMHFPFYNKVSKKMSVSGCSATESFPLCLESVPV